MDKLDLDLDDLEVDSFQATPEQEDEQGTVKGNVIGSLAPGCTGDGNTVEPGPVCNSLDCGSLDVCGSNYCGTLGGNPCDIHTDNDAGCGIVVSGGCGGGETGGCGVAM